MRTDQLGPVLRLTLDRAERRNTLDVATIDAISAAMHHVADDRSIRVVVLAAEGRVWCAGADLASLAAHPSGRQAAMHSFADAIADLAECPVPVVAAIDGAILGGGVALLCAADIALASSAATVALPEAGVGLWPMMVGALLPRVTTPRVAMDLAVTGRKVDAGEAQRLGLFSSIAADSAALGLSVATAVEMIVAKSPFAVRAGRKAWREHGDEGGLRDRMHALADALDELAQHPDAAEGISAFFEKRPPRWQS